MNTPTTQTPDAVRAAPKPCPFCGAQAKWVEDNGEFDRPFGLVAEHADSCFLSFAVMRDWKAIVAAWNTRATPAPAVDAVPVDQPSRADAIGTALRIGIFNTCVQRGMSDDAAIAIVKGTMAQLCVASALAKGKAQ